MDKIRGIQSLCNLTLNINGYILRAIESYYASSTSEELQRNWQFPDTYRFDPFIKEYFKGKKRCYFYGLGSINTLDENLWIPLNEADKVDPITHAVKETKILKFPTTLIDVKLTDQILKDYKFVDLTKMKINSKIYGDQQPISEIAKFVDLKALEKPEVRDKIVGIKVYSKYIGNFSNYPHIKYNNLNVILFDNNPVYEQFIIPGNHTYTIIKDKLK